VWEEYGEEEKEVYQKELTAWKQRIIHPAIKRKSVSTQVRPPSFIHCKMSLNEAKVLFMYEGLGIVTQNKKYFVGGKVCLSVIFL
jgi:hypothetical protein